MPSSNDKVGGFLTSCVLLLAVAFYVVGFEPVTCSPINQPVNRGQRGGTLVITLDVTGLSPEQIQHARNILRHEMICNLKRLRGKVLWPNCTDATTTAGPAIVTTADPIATTFGYTLGEGPDPEKRRRRSVLEEANDFSDGNLQPDIRSAPDADPNGRRKRRDASNANGADCEDLLDVGDVGDVSSDTSGSLSINIALPEDCGGNDTTNMGDLTVAAQQTNSSGRFTAKTNATIGDISWRYDSDTTYFTTEETTITTTAMITTTTEETTTTTAAMITTTEETTTTTAAMITTTEETTTTTAAMITTTGETTTTTTDNNIITTYYSTNPTTDNITITDTSAALNSTSPLPCLMSYKTWLPIVIVLIVLLITFIFLWRYQKGKKQRRIRPPQADSTGPPMNPAQPRPSEAENGRGPPTVPNHQPVLLDGDCGGRLIPMREIQ